MQSASNPYQSIERGGRNISLENLERIAFTRELLDLLQPP